MTQLDTAATRSTPRAPAVAPDATPHLRDTGFSGMRDRDELRREARATTPATQTTSIPQTIERAVQRETALFVEQCTRPEAGSDLTPISPRVREFIENNPLAAKHFVTPSVDGKSIAYAGKTELARANVVFDELDRSANLLMEMQQSRIPLNSKDFQAERRHIMSLAAEYEKLTGVKMGKWGHYQFSARQNAQGWATERERLRDGLDNAAYRAQEKQLGLVEKFSLSGSTPWIDGIKRDKATYNRFVSAVKELSAEGAEHPIVQARTKGTSVTITEAGSAPSTTTASARAPGTAPTAMVFDNLSSNLLRVAESSQKVDFGITPAAKAREQDLQRLTAQALSASSREDRGTAYQQLATARETAPAERRQIYDDAMALLRTPVGSTETHTALGTFRETPEVRKPTAALDPEAIAAQAKADVEKLVRAATVNVDEVSSAVVTIKMDMATRSVAERKQYAAALEEYLAITPIESRVEAQVGSEKFKAPLSGTTLTPETLARNASASMKRFITETSKLSTDNSPQLESGTPAAHLWNAASSERDPGASTAVVKRELTALFESRQVTEPAQVEAIKVELTRVLDAKKADPTYIGLIKTLDTYTEQLKADQLAIEKLRNAYNELYHEQRTSGKPPPPGELLKRAFGAGPTPSIDDLRRYSKRIEWLRDDRGLDANPRRQQAIKEVLGELSARQLEMLAEL